MVNRSLNPPVPLAPGEKVQSKRVEPRLLRLSQIIGRTTPPTPPLVPVGRTTILDWVKQSKFPPPVKIGNCLMWRYADVMRWIEQDGQWSEEDNERAA